MDFDMEAYRNAEAGAGDTNRLNLVELAMAAPAREGLGQRAERVETPQQGIAKLLEKDESWVLKDYSLTSGPINRVGDYLKNGGNLADLNVALRAVGPYEVSIVRGKPGSEPYFHICYTGNGASRVIGGGRYEGR